MSTGKRSRPGSYTRKYYKRRRTLGTSIPRTVGTFHNYKNQEVVICRTYAFEATMKNADNGFRAGVAFSNRGLRFDLDTGPVTPDWPGFADMSALFDLTRLEKVEVSVFPCKNVMSYDGVNGSNATGTGGGILPILYTAQDDNDANIPLFADITQYNNVQISLLDKMNKRTYYMKTGTTTALSNGVVVDNAIGKYMWTSTSNTDYNYKGCKMIIRYHDVMAMYDYDFTIVFKAFFKCKNIK